MDIEKILDRLSEITGARSQKEMAEKIGMKPGNFSAKKNSGTLINDIVSWGIKEKQDLNYLVYGAKRQEEQNFKNKVIEEIAKWIDENEKKNDSFKFWFLYELEQKFPEFKEWRRGKEQTEGKDVLDLFKPISQNNSK